MARIVFNLPMTDLLCVHGFSWLSMWGLVEQCLEYGKLNKFIFKYKLRSRKHA